MRKKIHKANFEFASCGALFMELPFRHWSYVVLLVLILVSVPPEIFLHAQSTEGAVVQGLVNGTVMDPRGQAISRASVTVKRAGATYVHNSVTDSEGRFSVTGLSSGTYSVD